MTQDLSLKELDTYVSLRVHTTMSLPLKKGWSFKKYLLVKIKISYFRSLSTEDQVSSFSSLKSNQIGTEQTKISFTTEDTTELNEKSAWLDHYSKPHPG